MINRGITSLINKHDDSKILGGIDQLISMHNPTPFDYFNAEQIDLDVYDEIIFYSSGGKDSLCCLIELINQGADLNKIHMVHHLVDGDGENFFDWPYVSEYNRALAYSFGIRLSYAYAETGLKGEMLKNNEVSAPIIVKRFTGEMEVYPRPRAKKNTRLKFPQQSGNHNVRWCSSHAKIGPGNKFITSNPEYIGKKILTVTGERRSESSSRAILSQLSRHGTDTIRGSAKPTKPRLVDHWRPILNWSEDMVWDALQNFRFNGNKGIEPGLAYQMSFSRSSCISCVFNSDRIWATLLEYNKDRVYLMSEYEREFGVTIARSGLTVLERAKKAKPFIISDPKVVRDALSYSYTRPIFTNDEKWELPPGAFSGEKAGS
ncbi:phosphoadenosine phosphosulfate reductase family protein [Aliivibrio salmonicida]|nr:phosphoadenosine phosphosulfate reductase family protein [Aliivibrio salmonicida]